MWLRHRRRRIRAHAAVVGAGVAVADALVVLRGRHRQREAAVDHRDEAGFLAVEELFDHHARARFAEGVAGEHVGYRGLGLGQGPRHDHALAGGQAVGLAYRSVERRGGKEWDSTGRTWWSA